MSARGTLSTGEPAELESFDGDLLVLVCARAFAPGAPLTMSVQLSDGELAVTLKCHGSKRIDDAGYRVRGRAISMRREDRTRLVAALRPADPT